MTTQNSAGAKMQMFERAALASVGVGLIAFGWHGGTSRKLLLSGTGAVLAVIAAMGTNPLATALKIRQNDQGETLVSDAVTIGRPAAELYAIWRNLEGLPDLMTHLKRVDVQDEKRSHWVVQGPLGEVAWDAELTADVPGERIAWTSLPGAAVQNSGEVLFRPAPGDRGTELVVRLTYHPPGGTAGVVIARVAGQEPSQQLRDDLMKFKREQELGYAPTTQGQTSGRARSGAQGGQK